MSEKDLKTLAIQTLTTICRSKTSSSTAKSQAARTILELEGLIGRLQSDKNLNVSKGLHEMSDAQLSQELERLRAALESKTSGQILDDTGQGEKSLMFPDGWT